MTDNEIVKALEYCVNEPGCAGCIAYSPKGCQGIDKYILDLINRQQAEIDRYKAEHKEFVKKLSNLHSTALVVMDRRKEIETEAINEFAERLTDKTELIKVNAFDYRWGDLSR